MTNPEKILQTWTTLKQLIISAKDNCKQKLAECKEHGQQLKELLESLNKDWTELDSGFDTELRDKWITNDFTYEKVKILLEAKIITGYQYDFAIWLKDTKRLKVFDLTDEQLIQLAQEWDDDNRAGRIRGRTRKKKRDYG